MFRGHALRASRRAYVASAAGVVGTLVAEKHEGDNQTAQVDAVSDVPPQSTIDDAESSAVPDPVSIAAVAPEPHRTVFPDLPEKLSIYPRPTPTLLLLDTPSPLELRIARVRREVCGYYLGARAQVQGVIDRWIHIEEAVESRLTSFRDPAEPLTPGVLYTGISALTASVVVRSRSLPVRILLPPLSCVGAFAYFLPRTAGRVGGWIEELEGRYVPRVGEVRRTGGAHARMALVTLEDKYRQGREGLGRGVRAAVEYVERGTGLKLGGALGWTRTEEDKKTGEEERKK